MTSRRYFPALSMTLLFAACQVLPPALSPRQELAGAPAVSVDMDDHDAAPTTIEVQPEIIESVPGQFVAVLAPGIGTGERGIQGLDLGLDAQITPLMGLDGGRRAQSGSGRSIALVKLAEGVSEEQALDVLSHDERILAVEADRKLRVSALTMSLSASATQTYEGRVVTYTLAASGGTVRDGSRVAYRWSGTGFTSGDIQGAPSGYFTFRSNRASASFLVNNDNLVEGTENWFFFVGKAYVPLRVLNGLAPTPAPSVAPVTPRPTLAPTQAPSTPAPTLAPATPRPTLAPTPTPAPTAAPTLAPATPRPTLAPTPAPTQAPPAPVPTAAPTAAPFSRYVPVSGYSNTIGYGLADATAAGSSVLGRQLTDGTRFAGFPQGQLKCEGLWATGARGAGVLVAVIDSGLQTAHPDLSSNVWVNSTERNGVSGRDDDGNGFVDDVNGWNAILQSGNVQDDNGHGTHVSGTIAALDNGVGVLGVAPQAKIMSVKVVGADGSGSLSSFIAGLDYAVRNRAKVINMSLGGGPGSPVEDEALSAAARAGAVLVMAAGNEGLASPDAPALYASRFGLAVGAVDSTGAQASFSNRSGFTSMGYVTAPGVQIVSTYLNGQYARMSGTSMASPHVAGLAALLWSAKPTLTAAQIESAIYQTATRR